MRVKSVNELLAINILSALLIIIIVLLPSNPLRIVLGLPFILFSPGYALVSALFPKKAALEGVERIALSFGLSIAIAPLIGLILNYTPWGIELYSILVSLAVFILVASIAAWYRRRSLPAEEVSFIYFNISLSQWATTSHWDKILSLVLVLALLGAVGAIAYVLVAPKEGENFTEFYILGLDGKAEGYPTELAVGEEGKVIVGIVNHEHKDLVYRVEILIDGENVNDIEPQSLAHEEKWEGEAGFSPAEAGEDQKVEFVLYKQGENEPYRSLYLWLDVKEAS